MLDVVKLIASFVVLATGLGGVANWVTSKFLLHVQWGIELDVFYLGGGLLLMVAGWWMLKQLVIQVTNEKTSHLTK